MLTSRIYLLLLLLGGPLFPAATRAAEFFNAENFPGSWSLVTNADATISATETAIHRQDREVYSLVLDLQAVPVEIPAVNPNAATEPDIRRFIADYRPPEIPYTSEHTAIKTGRPVFNCLEFAGDLVKKANEDGIPAQIIGILFEGHLTGHAVAGFPTADGRMLYFDSTPGAGQISHEAHEAHVQIGQPYTRAGGGELAVVGHLPVTEIIPVTKIVNLAASLVEVASPASGSMAWVVTGVRRVPAEGIDYADTNTLQISDAQLARWKAAASQVLAAKTQQELAQTWATRHAAAQAAARALEDNQRLAAQNDPYGQLRMGERYLKGDGVPKNPVLGRAYLKQAADQGSPTAMEELDRLTGKSSLNFN